MHKSVRGNAAPSRSRHRPADALALADGVADQPKKRSHHKFRGTPPPPTFDFDALPDGALLNEYETAAVGRWSTNTLAAWRLRGHGLRWVVIAGGFIRYRVSAIRAFLADAAPRKRKPAKREPRSRATADAVPAPQEPAR